MEVEEKSSKRRAAPKRAKVFVETFKLSCTMNEISPTMKGVYLSLHVCIRGTTDGQSGSQLFHDRTP